MIFTRSFCSHFCRELGSVHRKMKPRGGLAVKNQHSEKGSAALPVHEETGVESFNWRYQDKAYNESYKRWRRRNHESVGFYSAERPNLFTYQDGVGFISGNPEAQELKAFKKVLSVLGTAMLMRMLLEFLSMYFLPPLLNDLAGYNYRGNRGA